MRNLVLQPLKTFLHFRNACGHQTWQDDDLPREALTHKVPWPFYHIVWGFTTWETKNFISPLPRCQWPPSATNSHPELFLGKGVLKIYSNFTAKTRMPKCNFNKLLCNFIEVPLRHGCSPVNLLHNFRKPFFKNTSEDLLLELWLSMLHLLLPCTLLGYLH